MINFRPFYLLFSFSLAIHACGKKSSDSPPTTSLIDLTTHDVLQFKSATTTFGIGASRYDLNLSEKSVEKFEISSETSTYESKGKVTLSDAVVSSLKTKLQKAAYRKWSTCGDCNKARATVWIEITNIAKPLYFFANQGDCACPSDGENAPTLKYDDIKNVYDQLLGAF